MIIDDAMIGEGNPCFIIAEAGINHNGDVSTALDMVDVAKDCCADAIKFQYFNYKMLEKYQLTEEEFADIQKHCDDIGIIFLATPFDTISADVLNDFGVPAFKIASGFLKNHSFLKHVSNYRKPMLISTGMCDNMEDVMVAKATCHPAEVAFMHCISGYPTPVEQLNLRAMRIWNNSPFGFSDHTEGYEASIMATALGASIIEKHFTLDKSQDGKDHKMSAEPDELEELVYWVRKTEEAMGDGIKRIMPCEQEAIQWMKRRK